MDINSSTLGNELRFLFQKYYLLEVPEIIFEDIEIYEEALIYFEFDFRRYFPEQKIIKEKLYSRIELIGILLYRISRVYYLKNQEKTANHFCNLLRIICGFEIYYSAEIGKGIKINHGLGTVIGARCKIGENALIHQNVTFGDRNGGRPILLDNVSVYAGAKVLGAITCGNNSVIAANCVCMIDVPDNGLIAGVPGRLKK
jgi:serine O-acetyltransferase